jgi:hypothetical protein
MKTSKTNKATTKTSRTESQRNNQQANNNNTQKTTKQQKQSKERSKERRKSKPTVLLHQTAPIELRSSTTKTKEKNRVLQRSLQTHHQSPEGKQRMGIINRRHQQ